MICISHVSLKLADMKLRGVKLEVELPLEKQRTGSSPGGVITRQESLDKRKKRVSGGYRAIERHRLEANSKTTKLFMSKTNESATDQQDKRRQKIAGK